MTAKLTEALCAFHKDVATIHKEARGNFGKYADLATVLSAILPALSKNGLALVQTFEPCAYEGADQLLVTTLLHSSGEKIESRCPLIINKGRNPLHDWGGATTYTRRYAALAILCLAAGIEDDDGESAAPAPQLQQTKPQPVKQTSKTAPPAPKPAKPAESPEPPALDPADQPLPKAERDEIMSLIAAFGKDARTKAIYDRFCGDFRKAFNVPATEKVGKYLVARRHGDWAQQFIESLKADENPDV